MLEQIFIAVFGVSAVFLTQVKNQQLNKYACIFGLLSQPFWFYSAYVNEQWGIFALCFFYLAAWLVGFKNYWLNPAVNTGAEKPANNYSVRTLRDDCECGKSKPRTERYCWDCAHDSWLWLESCATEINFNKEVKDEK